ncbi:MAG: hypothetical protein JEZ02_04335 [Desulfatibacillum sp.]|nr:hypothetical protein [Desulfatibacillum sp.]
MKNFLIVGFAVCLLFGGCAAKTHYTEARDGNTSLYLKMPKAKNVQLVSSGNRYLPINAQRGKKGVWSVSVPSRSSFDYFYIVDGVPYSPPCLLSRPDGFGNKTCIYDPEP